MAFLETPRFPECISEGSRGGARWDTRITISKSGYEQRDERWENALHEYNAAFGVRDIEDLEDLKSFFMGMRGSVHGFRYKDWEDFKSCSVVSTPSATDQVIGEGDGAETQFQLIKRYQEGYIYDRPIRKPVSGTVLVALDSVPQVGNWSVDTTTGVITFDAAPGALVEVTAGYEFDVPCRFGSDQLQTQLEVYQLGTTSVPIVEIRI